MDVEAARAIGAGIAMGVGSLGPGIGLGMLVAKALEGAARQPEATNNIRIIMFIGVGVTEAIALYCFIIALILILVV